MPWGLKVAGRHDSKLTLGRTGPDVTVPPVAETVIALPEADAAKPLFIPIDVEVAPPAMVTLITATVPFAITLAVIPETTHV